MSNDLNISGKNWRQALQDAKNDGLICRKTSQTEVFHPTDEQQIANNPHLSIKEISDISQHILAKTKNEAKSKNIKQDTINLINNELKKAEGEVEKTHHFGLNVLKWISYVSVVFIPVGLAISWHQRQTEIALKMIQNLQEDWKNNLTKHELATIGKALSEKSWTLPTEPAKIFKDVLKEAIIKEKLVPLGSLSNSSPEDKQYMVPEQADKDFLRTPAIELNNNLIYSHLSSDLQNINKGFESLLKVFNETAEKHPITNGVLIALSQTMFADIVNLTTGPTEDNTFHVQDIKPALYAIHVDKDTLIIEMKTIASHITPEETEEKPRTLRAISRKLTMSVKDLKNAVEQIEQLKKDKSVNDALKEELNLLQSLTGEDRISDDLFKASNDDQLKEADIQLIGIKGSIRDLSSVNLSGSDRYEIAKNFNATSNSAGIWDKEKAWKKVQEGVSNSTKETRLKDQDSNVLNIHESN